MSYRSWLSSLKQARCRSARKATRRLRRHRTLFCEGLEDRRLLAITAVVTGTSVAFMGDGVAEAADLTVDSGYLALNGSTDLNGDASANDLLVADVTSLTYNDTGNNDTLRFEGSNAFNFSSAPAVSLGTTNAIRTLIVSQDVSISGTGTFTVEAARNIVMNSGSSITTLDGTITLRANQGATTASGNFRGIDLNNANITSTIGDILLQGRGGDDAGNGNHYGVYVHGGSQVESLGTSKVDAATITINGTGGNGTNNNIGVFVDANSKLSSVAGDIAVTGTAGNGTGQGNRGVSIIGGVVESTGLSKADAARITINGTGGAGTTRNHGVRFHQGARVSSVAGNMSVTGTGGGTGNFNVGIRIRNNNIIESTGTSKADAATITISGTGGNGTGNNQGVLVNLSSKVSSVAGDIAVTGTGTASTGLQNIGVNLTGGVVESTGTTKADAATITVTGTGDDGAGKHFGVLFQSNGRVSSVAGDISIIGQGGNGTQFNIGVYLVAGGVVESTGTSKADAATITIDGTAGNGTDLNNGVFVNGAGSRVSSVDGNIMVTGQAGNGTNNNSGVRLQSGGVVESTGTSKVGAATITINGTGGVGTENANHGVHLFQSGARVSSVAGDISIAGQAANAPFNAGVSLQSGGVVESTGLSKANAATITINGTGGGVNSTGSTLGVHVVDAGSKVSSVAGDITVTGQSGGTGPNNHGVRLEFGGAVESAGTSKADAATITINGTGGTGGIFNHGVIVDRSGSRVTSVAGDIELTGQGGSGSGGVNIGVNMIRGGAVESTGTTEANAGTITINGTGGTGANTNIGFNMDSLGGANPRVTSVAGDIELTGQGGNGSGGVHIGVSVFNGSVVESTGTTKADAGTITINGTGGTGGPFNFGVNVASSGARVRSVAGDVELTGQGGSGIGGVGANTFHIGVRVFTGGGVESTGTTKADAATITLNGTGGDGTSNNYGVEVAGAAATVSSTIGDISITGQGGAGSGDTHDGIRVISTGTVASSGGADVDLVGTAGTGISRGVIVISGVMTNDGNIDVTGTGSGGAASIQATGIDAGTGAVSLTAPTGIIRENGAGTDITASTMTINGEVAPGGSAGQLIVVGDVAFGSGSAYTVEIGGNGSINHDQLDVAGTVTIDPGVTLNTASLGGFIPLLGETFTIIDNDAADAVFGEFDGLAEGGTINNFLGSGLAATISYLGGDGNDVVLTVVDPLQNLIDCVDTLNDEGVLNNGNANALTSKLQNAQKSLDKGNLTAAVNQLNAFGNQVEAFRNSGNLTDEQANDLIEKLEALLTSLLE